MPYVQIGYKYKQLAPKYDFFLLIMCIGLCTLSLFLAHHILEYRVPHDKVDILKWLWRNMQVRCGLKVVWESWDWIFLGITTSFCEMLTVRPLLDQM